MAIQRLIADNDFDTVPYLLPQDEAETWTLLRRVQNEVFVWTPCGTCGGCKYNGLSRPPYGPVIVAMRPGMLSFSAMGHADFLIEAEELTYEEILRFANGLSVGAAFHWETDRWDVLPYVEALAGRPD